MESHSESYEDARKRTLVLMEVYSSAGVAHVLEAERMVQEAMERRDMARALFDRATALALEFSSLPRDAPELDTYDDIPW